MEIKIKIEPNWIGKYRLTYDGKYVELLGLDKSRPINQVINHSGKDEYAEEILIPVVCEIRNGNPVITNIDKEYIYIETDNK